MIPPDLTEEHFLQAATWIDNNGVPVNRQSYRYDLVLRGKKYPPKYIISLASRFATGVEYPPARFNAVEAKNYFIARRYDVVEKPINTASVIVSEDDESVFPEGNAAYRQHRTLERDSNIARKAKDQRWKEAGKLQCDVCSLDFEKMYGPRGRGFIEAHHTVPVAAGPRETRVSEIALVCSNCHRMLHRGTELLSLSELREIVEDNRG